MNVSPAMVQKHKIGTCPHGLPLGACPICNGMGGGGGSSKKAAPSNEMSWDECYAVWQQMLKAKDIAQQKREMALQAQMQTPVSFTNRLDSMAQKMGSLVEKLMDFTQNRTQSMPKIFAKPLVMLAKVAIPILNVLKEIPVLTQKVINFVQEKLADISDKLNAIFGELKNSTEKKISERFKDIKKKFKSLFGIFEPTEVDDEDKKIEEAKRLFDLKTAFNSIKERFTQKNQETLYPEP